jgi:hypothetical protein
MPNLTVSASFTYNRMYVRYGNCWQEKNKKNNYNIFLLTSVMKWEAALLPLLFKYLPRRGVARSFSAKNSKTRKNE